MSSLQFRANIEAAFVAFIFCLFSSGCSRSHPVTAPVTDEQYCEHILSTGHNQAEALSWLEKNDGRERTVGNAIDNLDPAKSLALVKQLYGCGAVKVTAVNIDTDANTSSTETLIISMPKLYAGREKLFAIANKIGIENGFDLEPDEDQKYTMVHW